MYIQFLEKRKDDFMEERKLNVAVVGGGLSTLVAFGGYAAVHNEIRKKTDTYSGASLGSLIVVSLSAGKSVMEILNFLADNALLFSMPIVGKEIMRKKIRGFLGNVKFKNLPKECFVSVTPVSKYFPNVITQENAGEMTVSDIIVASCSVPWLYLPTVFSRGNQYYCKISWIFEGGLTLNPPLNPEAKNVTFSYENPSSLKENSWNKRARFPQNRKTDLLFNPYTEKFGMLGGRISVLKAFEFGYRKMEQQKNDFLRKLEEI